MAIGTGLPISAFLSGLGNGNAGNLLERGRNIEQTPENQRNNGADRIDLSNDSRAVLSQIREGLEAFQRQDAQLASQQLSQIREQISFVSNALAEAGGDQRDVILGQVEEIARQLAGIGEDIASLAASGGRVEAQAVNASFSASFNAVAQTPEGTVSVAEELNVEFSFVQASNGDTEVTSVQLSVESERSVSFEVNGTGANFESLIGDFRNALRDFADLVADIQKQFEIEEIPEPFIDLIRGLVTSELDDGIDGPVVLDTEA